MKEEGADARMKFHLSMWNTNALRATKLNNPGVNEMENLKNIFNRLSPRSNKFQQMFGTLGNRQINSYHGIY